MNNKCFISIKKAALTLMMAIGFMQVHAADDPDAGKAIFTSTCASCHAIDKDVTGPALGHVDQKDKIEWIIKFVKGSQAMVKAGDKRAVELFNDHNQTVMPDHPNLSDQDIRNIMAYVNTEADRLAKEPKANTTDNRPPYLGSHGALHQLIYLDIPGNHTPVKPTDYSFWFLLAGALFIVICILSLAVRTNDITSHAPTDDADKY